MKELENKHTAATLNLEKKALSTHSKSYDPSTTYTAIPTTMPSVELPMLRARTPPK